MSTCSALGSSKDSNAQFSTRIYSSSDVTRMIRNNGVRNNYLELTAKGETPRGGAPHADFYAIAHTVGSFAAASSLTTVSYNSCVPCNNDVPFQPAAAFGVIRNVDQY
jgi:pyrimidine deaminase RibD-like protein